MGIITNTMTEEMLQDHQRKVIDYDSPLVLLYNPDNKEWIAGLNTIEIHSFNNNEDSWFRMIARVTGIENSYQVSELLNKAGEIIGQYPTTEQRDNDFMNYLTTCFWYDKLTVANWSGRADILFEIMKENDHKQFIQEECEKNF